MQTAQTQIIYSATTFRQLLDSLARPGKINRLEYPDFLGELPAGPAQSVNLYALGAMQTLLDREQRAGLMVEGQWLAEASPLWAWLSLRSGANWAEPDKADFVLFENGDSGGRLAALSPGTLLEPENSATAFYAVQRLLEQPTGQPDELVLQLTGPGIADVQILSVTGLAPSELELIQASRRAYPLGVDIYLVDTEGRCVGLPRTTRLETI